MNAFSANELKELVAARDGPCVSMYSPVVSPSEDPIRWKTLLSEAEGQLTAVGTRAPEARELLKPLAKFLADPAFERGGAKGLALFLAPGLFRHYILGTTLPERVSVGREFDIRPLLPWVANGGHCYVLALSQNAVRLIRATAHSAERIALPGPANRDEALRTHDTDEPLNYHAFAGAGGRQAVFHGHGVGIDDAKTDLVHYFREVDKALHTVLKGEHAPLVLASVDYLQPLFRQASTYPALLDEGLSGSPDRLSDRELAERAWRLIQPITNKRRDADLNQYRELRGTGRTEADTAAVLSAAANGNVKAVFVTQSADIWGRVDRRDSKVAVHGRREPGDDELTNLAAVFALRHGRAVHTLKSDEMPDKGPLAAILPLPLAKHA